MKYGLKIIFPVLILLCTNICQAEEIKTDQIDSNIKTIERQDTNFNNEAEKIETHSLDEKLDPEKKTQDISSEEVKWYNGDYLTGNWGGARKKLEDKGIKLEVTYYSEPFFKTHGGIKNDAAARYRGLVDFSVTFDTKKLGLWPGGTIYILGQNIHGNGLSEREVGDFQALSSIDAPDRTQLSEYFWEQQIIEDRLAFKIGKQDANADFSITDIWEYYINSSFTLNPTIPMPTYPDPTLGVAVFARPYKGWKLKAGVYDGEGGGQFGFKTAFDGKGGTFVITETSIEHNLKGYSGKYMVGFWHHSADAKEIIHEHEREAAIFGSTYGIYSGFSQMIFKENKDKEDTQGLFLHGQFGWTPGDRSELCAFYSGGLAYQGLIPHRPNDAVGIGFTTADFSPRVRDLEGRSVETALEIFYNLQLTPFLSIQPDLQYIFNPNGNVRDSLAIGLRTIIRF